MAKRDKARVEYSARDVAEPEYELDDNDEVKEVDADEESRAEPGDDDHYENLAEHLEDDVLDKIAAEIIEQVKDDEESRAEWANTFKRGLKIMGLEKNEVDDGPFPGAAIVTHPLMNEAIVQFWARAMGELCPPEGPVKGKVLGKETQQKLDASARIEDYMNNQLMFEDKGYRAETSRLVFAIPQQGSAFRKTFRNTELDYTQGIYVPAEHFIVPFAATNLDNAPRFTHRQRLTPNEVKKKIKSGLYRKVDLPKPSPEELTIEEQKKAEIEDKHQGTLDHDARHQIYETYIDYSIPGYEDEDGIDLPYICTVEVESSKVLAIRRNWRKDDPLYEKRIYFTHYEYIPGFGFYGLGLFHLIGALSEAATGALRAILDGAAFASLQGGFKTKDASGVRGGQLVIEPGVWKDVDLTADELSKSFYTPPFKEPSRTLYELLGLLVDAGRRFASITETMVGEADNKAPVGTTVALIEQGSKVFTAIHQGLHAAATHEFKLRYEINAEFIPEEGYTYDVEGDEREVYKADFNKHTDVVPTADPNLSSSTHRIAVAQATYQLYKEDPQEFKGRKVIERVLQAMKVPEYEELLADTDIKTPLDPVAENQAILTGRMIRVFPEQDHAAHIAVHLALAQNPGFLANPMLQQQTPQILAAMQAHIAAHLAGLHASQVTSLGVSGAYMIDTQATDANKVGRPEDSQVSAMAAKFAQQIAQMPGLPPPPPEPDPAAEAKQKLQAAEQLHQQQLKQKDEAHQQQLAHTQQRHDMDMANRDKDAGQKRTLSAAEAEQNLQQKADDGALDLALKAEQGLHDQASRELDHEQDTLDRESQRQQSQQDFEDERERSRVAAADETAFRRQKATDDATARRQKTKDDADNRLRKSVDDTVARRGKAKDDATARKGKAADEARERKRMADDAARERKAEHDGKQAEREAAAEDREHAMKTKKQERETAAKAKAQKPKNEAGK